jgi:hypothetical protein
LTGPTRLWGFLFVFAISTTMTTHYGITTRIAATSHTPIDGPCIREFDLVPCYRLHLFRHLAPSLAFSLHARLDVLYFLRRRSASSSSSYSLHPMNGPSYSLIETSPRVLISIIIPFMKILLDFPPCGSIGVLMYILYSNQSRQAELLEKSVNYYYRRCSRPDVALNTDGTGNPFSRKNTDTGVRVRR